MKERRFKPWFINRYFTKKATGLHLLSVKSGKIQIKRSYNPSVVCLLMLSSQQMKAQSDLSLTAILNPLRDLRGPVFCILNMLTAPSAHTVAMATMDHLWLRVHLSANTPSCTHTYKHTAILLLCSMTVCFCIDKEILSTCAVDKAIKNWRQFYLI